MFVGWMRRCAGLTIAAGLTIGGAAAAQAAPNPPPEKSAIVFGILPTMEYIPVELAIQKGYFKEEGLDVTARVVAASAQVPGILGGALDISGVNWISTLIAINQQIPIKVVAEADRGRRNYFLVMVRPDSPIKSLKDLVGKKLASPAPPPATCDTLIRDELRRTGGTAEGINFTDLPVPQMMPALAQGSVDAICLTEPLITPVLEKKEARSIADMYAGSHDNLPLVNYSVSESFAQKNPNTVAALARAIARAQKLCVENPAEVRAILPAFAHMTPEEAKNVVLPGYVIKPDQANIMRLAKLMESLNIIKHDFKVPTVGGP